VVQVSLTGFSDKKSKKCLKQQKNVCKEKKVLEIKLVPELVIPKNSVVYSNKKVDPKSKWLIIELAEDISFEEHSDVIEHHISVMFKDTEYFVPFFKEKIQDKVVSLILFEGYFFVRSIPIVTTYPDKFHNEYIKGPMKKNRAVIEIPGVKINELKHELKLKLKERVPKLKQIVIPKIGIFSNLEGEVIAVDKRSLVAIVKFQYTTRIVEAPISFINLTIKS
jgi:hypothetical protein